MFIEIRFLILFDFNSGRDSRVRLVLGVCFDVYVGFNIDSDFCVDFDFDFGVYFDVDFGCGLSFGVDVYVEVWLGFDVVLGCGFGVVFGLLILLVSTLTSM